MEVCLGLNRRGALWADVAPRFKSGAAQGCLLDRLLPRIMAGQLSALAPEVMQASTSLAPMLQGFEEQQATAVRQSPDRMIVRMLQVAAVAHTTNASSRALCVHA